ncbi:hypothetical protein G7047_19830 [Diaphorobacter sp. HDW4A]|uniref:tetratricopeptide repeat protein n=1 Tax=Diaphorobacter sp. HDW4A TaxID=2714924 RepID=UPI0014094B3D|nr:hypothetical protein [Diaphorobacter sp. HDW4A]QIL81921.1 hypothetical protein G7047_19830 [Diaphorobacter sp. HDW4A]
MDSFAWVNDLAEQLEEQGQQRLAYLIHDVPYQQYRGNHALVEALVPEALAAARSFEIPWLDIYFKHWLNASRIARHHGETQLGEVVASYESAHQERTHACPQSVCITQDLVATYANVDGPGWSEERLAACDETLARIDPSWSCFGCISIERANALHDQGQPREAVLYLKQQRDEQRRAGEEVTTLFVSTEVDQWLALGEPQTALKLLEESEEDSDDDDRREQATRLFLRTRATAMAGDAAAAIELLPGFDDIELEDYLMWCRAALAIARVQPDFNTPSLGHSIWSTIEHLHTVGNHRVLVDMALAQVDLSLARRVPWLAENAVARVREHLPMLRLDLGAAAKLDKASDAVAQASDIAAPCPPEELLEWLGSDAASGLDNEAVIQWLEQAHRAMPQDEDVAMTLATALSNFGCHDLARARLRAMVDAAPDSIALQNRWFGVCFKAEDHAAVEEQAVRIEATLPAQAAWYRARVAFRESRFAQIGPLIEQVLAHDPAAVATRGMWADAAMELKDFDTAVEQRRVVLDSEEQPEARQRWDLLIAATAAQQWAEVRKQAMALEMELDAVDSEDAPLEEDWGLIYLRHDESGRTRDVMARRTGPATARIVQPAQRGMDQGMNDWVVFVPSLAEQPPENEDEQEHYVRIYGEPLHVLEKGGHGPSYMVDGVHPGEEQIRVIRDALEAEGWSTWQYSSDGYRVVDSETQDESDEDDEDDEDAGLPGIYLAVTAPADVPPRVISAKLAAITKGMVLCWTELARDAGEPTERHEAMEERYGL